MKTKILVMRHYYVGGRSIRKLAYRSFGRVATDVGGDFKTLVWEDWDLVMGCSWFWMLFTDYLGPLG